MQLKKEQALYLVAMHCCALCTNLAIQAFFSFCIMQHLENLLESFHSYFARSPNCKSLQLSTTPKVKKICGMLKPTKFPCTLSPSKWVMAKYKILIMKMLEDQIENKVARFYCKRCSMWSSLLISIAFYHFLNWFTH